MTILGVDISSWSSLNEFPVDLSEQGYDFLFYKVSKGGQYQYGCNGQREEYGSVARAAIHVQTDESPSQQAYNLTRAVTDIRVPIILEIVAGDSLLTQDLITLLVREGYRVPLMYMPFWYWVKSGQPDLSSLPPVWGTCRVPAYKCGDETSFIGSDIYKNVPHSAWANYGNSSTLALHFTESAIIAGVESPMNVSAFAGTRKNLDYLLFSDNVLPTPSMISTDLYTIKANDSIWSIATDTLGDARLAAKIAKDNALADLDRLMPGSTLKIEGWNGRFYTGHVQPNPQPRVLVNSLPEI